jgi:hypothetical protein
VSGRVTRPPDPDDLPSMKQRNPVVWWVAVVSAAALVLTTATGLIAAILA